MIAVTFQRVVFALTAVSLCAGLSGCATMGKPAPSLVPTRHTLDVGPYRISTNEPLAQDSEAVTSLVALGQEVDRVLALPTPAATAPIEVYVLDDKATFHHFLKFYYPELPPRRAFFFAQGPRRVVYAYQGERLDVDLRHEACHALLHGAVANMPLWLDEGLAEYFENPATPTGLNRENLARLLNDDRDGWKPNLERLEGLAEVRQMTPRDYREAWCWVHFLLHDSTETRTTLLGYLNDLRFDPAATPLSQRLQALGPGRANTLLVEHLRGLRPGAMAATQTATKVRSQGGEPVVVAPAVGQDADPQEKSILGKLMGLMRAPFRRSANR